MEMELGYDIYIGKMSSLGISNPRPALLYFTGTTPTQLSFPCYDPSTASIPVIINLSHVTNFYLLFLWASRLPIPAECEDGEYHIDTAKRFSLH